PTTLDELVTLLHAELGANGLDPDLVDVDRVQALMASYKSNPKDWDQFALFDRSKPYTRNLVDDGNGKFNLMILCWSENGQSPIHDHAGAHCMMKVLSGQITETQYKWPGEATSSASPAGGSDKENDSDSDADSHAMKVRTENVHSSDQVAYIHDKIGLHRVSSRGGPAVSLHLYTPPFETCKTFCESTGQSRGSGKCVFFSRRGER
ncbi:RmlC-like cupin domain-containing protein, partial [Blyttiomyces helicus]